ncbi:MAG: hydroxysqualene dehydroxylase HpnE [Casimicrobiaceae bacterium]
MSAAGPSQGARPLRGRRRAAPLRGDHARANVAVVGGGYAGFAAAVTLAAAGRQVVVFEAARTLGGRGRRVDAFGTHVDNGAHILLGAYRQTLALLRDVHGPGAEHELLDRRRLVLEQPGVFRLRTPALPAPWHLAAGLLSMRGVSRHERLRTVAFVRRLQRGAFACAPQLSVAELLADQPAAIVAMLWEPLCLTALNTPTATASAQIFLNVLRLAFAGSARDSDLLLPRVDLSTLFPDAAAAFVTDRGGEIHMGTTVGAIAGDAAGVAITAGYAEQRFAAAVIAVGPHQLARVFAPRMVTGAVAHALELIAGFAYEPITTVYLQYPHALGLALPMFKLDGAPGQWVFDRGALGGPTGLASVVISTESVHARIAHATLAQAIDVQLRRAWPQLPAPVWTQVIAERRATYACTADLQRPAAALLAPHLYLAGDYTDTELPATLEAATRSGVAAARLLLATHS